MDTILYKFIDENLMEENRKRSLKLYVSLLLTIGLN